MRLRTPAGTVTRRQFLALLLASGFLPRSSAATSPGVGARPVLLRQWHSSNDLLAPLTLAAGKVLFAGNNTLGLLDLQREKPVWNVAHGFTQEAVFRPRATGSLVVAGGLGELGAWDAACGTPRWLHRATEQMGVPWVSPRHTYVGDGHELLAIDNASGTIRWRFAGTPDTLASYAPVTQGDDLFFSPGNGILYALSAVDGTLKWQLERGEEWQYLRQLHISGQVLVAGSYKELLYGISLTTGKVLWTFNAGNFINSHHVAGDTAYLWSPTGWVYAIDIHRGHVRWRHRTTDYGNTASNWAPMMAELTTVGHYLLALDMGNVLHVLDNATGEEICRIQFAQALRPSIVSEQPAQAVIATEEGVIQHVRWAKSQPDRRVHQRKMAKP